MPIVDSLLRIAEARFHRFSRHYGVRAGLISALALVGLIALGFLLLAATVALGETYGLLNALLIMAVASIFVGIVLAIALAVEKQRYRRRAEMTAPLDRQLRAVAIASIPRRMPSRTTAGLLMVAAGALLVLLQRRGDED